MSSKKKIKYIIDGSNFVSLEGFAIEVSRVFNINWKGNLEAFNDYLRDIDGSGEEGFIIIWKNVELSRKNLGYEETIIWLTESLSTAHYSHHERIKQEIEDAKIGEGKTLFDLFVDIINSHCAGGLEEDDNGELLFE